MKIILAIESSCDETSLAILDGGDLKALTISSQIELHRPYGGVVPELASRCHLEVIHPLLKETLAEAGVGFDDIDAVAVTVGPGLAGSLMVGVAVAKMIAALLDVPIMGVNHMEGHLYSVRLDHEVPCPYLCLVSSGGHTQLVDVAKEGQHKILGETRDDAAGEAFDKTAKLLGLPYPGGPVIDRLVAEKGDPKAIVFPRPMINEGYEFSFSGLKTAVRRAWIESDRSEQAQADIAASFQEAVVDVLTSKLRRAATDLGYRRLAVVGGVACNSRLRTKIAEMAEEKGIELFFPRPLYCTDNAAMIGRAAWDLKEFLLPSESRLIDVQVHMEMLGSSS